MTKQRLNIATDNYNGYFELELEALLRKMYSPAVYGDHYKIVEICDDSFAMPPGASQLWGVHFCDSANLTELAPFTFAPNLFFMSNVLVVGTAGGYTGNILDNIVTYQNGYWYFNTPTDELYVICYYEGFATDDNGRIMIPEQYENFLSYGLCDAFLLRFPAYFQNNISATAAIRREYNYKYISAKKQVNGIDQITRYNLEKGAVRFAQNKMRMNDQYWSPFNYYNYY